MDLRSKHSKLIREEAYRLGFDFVGFSKADFLEEEAPRLEQWLANNYHGKMAYMERWFDKRLDPRLLVDDAKSVVSLLLNYYPEKEQNPDAPILSRYAFGKDYHQVIKEKLKALLHFIHDSIGEVSGRAFVDSAPVLDRAWAKKSGLGWVGKNGNLIHPKNGSYFFIAELILDLPLEEDGPIQDYCGTCTRCIDACPTQAIVAPKVVDGSKCISYFTIELREAIPVAYKEQMENRFFGCDICQEVCPWNRFAKPSKEEKFQPIPGVLEMSKNDWEEITEEVFKTTFKDSPLKRSGFEGIKRNLAFISPRGERPGK